MAGRAASWYELLTGPGGRIEGTGKRIRHIKVRSGEAASSDVIRQTVRARLAVRSSAS